MKAIFLDIDGVLNCASSRSRCHGLIGIDNDKVKLLREIVESTGAVIVLCSSWKSGWERKRKGYQDEFGDYLDRKLRRERIHVFGMTNDHGSDRGAGIRRYLDTHMMIETWCVIDDEIFGDYEKYSIMDHLVKTSFYGDGGLHQEHVEQAIKLLGG